jgi:hypothetical protein
MRRRVGGRRFPPLRKGARVNRARLVGALALAALASGCGAGVKAADLFVVTRTGATPHERLTLLVDEEGGVNCNGGPTRKLSDPQIVKARAIQEELQSPAAAHVSLPARAGSVFSYFLREESGTVRFADNSAGQSKTMRELQLFVTQTAQEVCHL